MGEIPQWQVKGGWFDVCSCDVPCPCSWAEPPDDGYCEGILVWHIREGNYGDVHLDGLNVVDVGVFKGNAWDGPTDVTDAIFMDDRADDSQREALQMIFGGEAGGWPKKFGELVQGEVAGFEFVPIVVEIADDLSSWRAEIAGRVVAAGKALIGPTSEGKLSESRYLPGAEVGPSGVATWGKASADRADAFGLHWDHGQGKSSKYMSFTWSGPGET